MNLSDKSDGFSDRYFRQIQLPEIGEQGQHILKESNVLVMGAGGLGSPALLYLAAAGIGTIGFADYDQVEPTNLNRQILYSTADLGKQKVEQTERVLRQLNPELNLIPIDQKIDSNAIDDLIRSYDVIIDAVDQITTRKMINDHAYRAGIPVVEGAVHGFEGILTTIAPPMSACYRCSFLNGTDTMPETPNDPVGVLGAVTGIIGSMQALEAIKLILNQGSPLINRLLVLDGLAMRFREIELIKQDVCPVCGNIQNEGITNSDE
jgi:adenylyltransferase/sulfurtransferase